jgi:hypothetical protein
MTGGRLLRGTGGWSPPPEAGRGGGRPTHARGRAPAWPRSCPGRDDEDQLGAGQRPQSSRSSPSRGWWLPSWVTPGEGERSGWLMKILEAERWLKGTNSHGVAFLQRWGEKTAVSPIRGLGRWKSTRHKEGRRHGRLTKGDALLLKATPPACAPNRRGPSPLQHASKALPRGAGAGTHESWRPAPSRRSRTAAHDARNHPAVTSNPPLLPRPAGERGRQPCRRHATAPSGRASPTPDRPARRPKPTRRATGAPGVACEPLCRLRHHRTSSIAEPIPRFEATQRATQQRQPDAAVKRGQKWAGSNDGGRRARAAVTPSAKLTSHPEAAREPPLTV